MEQIQQGDVLLEKVVSIPKGAKKLDTRVLREGETTGHAHRVIDDAQLLEHNGIFYVTVGSDGATLVHEEHGPITLAPREKFRMVPGVFEHDYETEEAKRVID